MSESNKLNETFSINKIPTPSVNTPWLSARNRQEFLNSTMPQTVDNDDVEGGRLSRRQLAARQVFPRDLPQFSGDPLTWPMFISAFLNSTKACGYSNYENLARLQKSLKDRALEAVRMNLMVPETVPMVISTLQFLYGQPEKLLNACLQEVKKYSVIKGEKLELLVPFALQVQNFCATIEAAKMEQHMHNPLLIDELVNKLPMQLKLDWGFIKQNTPVATFNNWLIKYAEATSNVTNTNQFDVESSTQKKSNKQFQCVHSNYTDLRHPSIEPSQPLNKPVSNCERCRVCKKGNHLVVNCTRFVKSNVPKRWNFIRKEVLCVSCL